MRTLSAGDPEALRDIFHAFFASIPRDWYRKTSWPGTRAITPRFFTAIFAILGLEIILGDATSMGRIDLTVKMEDKVFIFEFKVNTTAKLIYRPPGTGSPRTYF